MYKVYIQTHSYDFKNILLPTQITIHFNFFRYIYFVMHLDIDI
jgi:hypothetical protein